MMTVEERRKILEMVAAGKLTAVDAAELLQSGAAVVETTASSELKQPDAPDWDSGAGDVPEEKAEAATTAQEPSTELEALVSDKEQDAASEASGPRWLHVHVSDSKTGKRKVSVNIPLRLVRIGMQIGQGFAPELRDVDWDTVAASLGAGEAGLLVDVQDDVEGEHVRIFVD